MKTAIRAQPIQLRLRRFFGSLLMPSFQLLIPWQPVLFFIGGRVEVRACGLSVVLTEGDFRIVWALPPHPRTFAFSTGLQFATDAKNILHLTQARAPLDSAEVCQSDVRVTWRPGFDVVVKFRAQRRRARRPTHSREQGHERENQSDLNG
jgi:hypothetical protein